MNNETKVLINRLAKALLKNMGKKPREIISYPSINSVLELRQGSTSSLISYVITSLEAGGYTIERMGAGERGQDLGQCLTAKGRRMSAQMRGER
jgi:hypothetical protein|tara:strand:- start:455 stop:736 length:282 start_codon:yes stop_codon:yes gene_type:complete